MNYRMAFVAFFALLLLCSVFAASCGNGSCESGENQCNCPADCGKCEGAYGDEACKELACVNGVCTVVNKSNCCGNTICEASESYAGCPADCTPKSVDITILSPAQDDFFLFGERVPVLVEILADQTAKVIGAEASASSATKKIQLYNDSKHSDGTSFDAVYGNYFVVTPDMLGSTPFTVEATFRGVKGTAEGVFVVRPDLNVLLPLPKEVALGDILSLTGTVLAKTKPVSISFDVNISFQGKNVFSESTDSDNSGKFYFSYPISLLEKLGVYTLSIAGSDANGNKAFFEKNFEVKQKVFTKEIFLSIATLPQEVFSRGTEIPLVVSLLDEEGNPVESAEVFANAFDEKIDLFEFEPGKYSASIFVPFAASEGPSSFEVFASKKIDGSTVGEASETFTITIGKTLPVIELIKPDKDAFKAGEAIDFEVIAVYPNQEKVINAEVFVLLGQREIQLAQTDPGHFVGSALLTGEDYDTKLFSVKIVDSYGNVNATERQINVSGSTISFFFIQNILWIGILVTVVALLVFLSMGFTLKKVTSSSKRKEVSGVEAEIKQLQINYFKKGLISRAEYEQEIPKLREKLRKAKERKVA